MSRYCIALTSRLPLRVSEPVVCVGAILRAWQRQLLSLCILIRCSKFSTEQAGEFSFPARRTPRREASQGVGVSEPCPSLITAHCGGLFVWRVGEKNLFVDVDYLVFWFDVDCLFYWGWFVLKRKISKPSLKGFADGIFFKLYIL